jgi:hypothetical protein
MSRQLLSRRRPCASVNLDATGILLVAVDEQVQPSAPTEALAVV